MPYTLSYTVGFSSNEARTIGSIRVTDTTDWAGQGIDPADIEIGIGITAPDGNAYRLDTVPQIGNIHPDVQLWMEFPLPTDVNGLVQTGNYIVSFHPVSSAGPSVDQTDTSTHNLCTDFPDLCLETNPDCLRNVVSITDATGWASAGWTVNSRSMILQYPSVTYHANITGAGPTISTSGEPIWAGTWTGTVTVSVTKDNYTVSITTVKQFAVSCDFDGCRLLCLLEQTYTDYKEAKARGDVMQTGRVLAKLGQMAAMSQIISMAIGCGDDTLLNTLITDFKILATGNSSGNCSCCDDCSEPRPIVPIWNSGGSSWTPLEGNQITITAGVNTYTFNVSDAFIALVNSHYNTEVISSDGSIAVTPSTVGIVKTFDLSVTKAPADSIEITWNVDLAAGTESLGSAVITGTFFQAPTIIESAGAKAYRVTDFLVTPVNSSFNASVWIEGRVLTAAMNAADRYASIVQAQVLYGQWQLGAGNQEFLFGLIPVGAFLGPNLGSSQLKSWYAGVLSKFSVRIQITKV